MKITLSLLMVLILSSATAAAGTVGFQRVTMSDYSFGAPGATK
jgi:hypothetical protein